MNAQLLQSAMLAPAEGFLNRVLALDAAAGRKLQKLSGSVLRVQCEFPPLTVNLQVSDDRIRLSGSDDLAADATVAGNAPALLKLLLTGKTGDLRDDGVVISGDTGLLQELQEILAGLDVDWEYRLSKVIGDIPTQAVSDGINRSRTFTRQAAANLRDDIDAYLHEEKKLFPGQPELENFYRAVDDLRLRVDRLAARTQRLRSNPRKG